MCPITDYPFPDMPNASKEEKWSLSETEPLLPSQLGGKLLNFPTEALASVRQIPAQQNVAKSAKTMRYPHKITTIAKTLSNLIISA